MKILLFLVFQIFLFADYSNKVSIFLTKDSSHIEVFAALELKKHLELILNEEVLISNDNNQNPEYIFYVGIIPENINTINDSNYIIKEKKIYLFGKDKIIKKENQPYDTILNMKNKVGTLFSVYDFLYNELNIRWIKPGNEGIFYKNVENLEFTNKYFSWNSDYNFRIIRNDIWDYDKFINTLQMDKYTPKKLQFSQNDVKTKQQEESLWKRRMKLDISDKPSYGHAFTKYWGKYSKTNPTWFALGENGKRGMEGFPKLIESRQKFCVSNIFLQEEIVNNWKKDYKKNGNNIYNASINDSRGYCTCDNCKLLDSEDHSHNEFQEKSKTDRYVYFWNSLLKKAKEFNPDSKIIAYAYSDYRYPPANSELMKDIILGFVPKFNDLPEETLLDLEKWKEKGLIEVFLRPNDLNDDIGLPMGHEKYIFDKFKIFKDTNIIGLDYDNAYSFNDWNFEGISRYILLQSFNNSKRSFEEIEDEYYSLFGASKNEIKDFYIYWRKNFETKRLVHIKEASGFHGRRFLSQNIKDYFDIKDFENTNKILNKALERANSENIKKLIENIIISNDHAKKTYEALISKDNYEKLVNYRIQNKDNLSLCWPQVFNTEKSLSNSSYIDKIFSKILDTFE
ncbi:MAG: DUF4838 domain-containing protein [Aliarcobacter sp.]|jgi:hypothetical protein|nr:DUF4838 domain-containing protein [Aliarcobacter sp.]